MKRRIAAAILVTLLPLGMAACGSQSKADACKLLEKPLEEASLALMESAKAGDVSSVGDTYATFASTYEEASKKITNKEIKESVDQVGGRMARCRRQLGCSEDGSDEHGRPEARGVPEDHGRSEREADRAVRQVRIQALIRL